MTKLLLSILLCMTLISCFETEINPGGIPFVNDNGGNQISYTFSIATTGTQEFFGNEGANLGSSPSDNQIKLPVNMCIKSFKMSTTLGSAGNFTLYSSGETIGSLMMSAGPDTQTTNLNREIFSHNGLYIENTSPYNNNNFHVTLTFENCDN